MKQVEKAKKDLLLTSGELAELLGISEGTLRNWSGSDKVPEWGQKAIAAHREIKELKEFKQTFKKLLE